MTRGYSPRLPRTATPEERFWIKVDKTGDCWLWTASTRRGGYGQFWNGSRLVEAHRFSWEASVGPIPEGLQIDHLCRTPPCVNPAHLEPVTRSENVRRGLAPQLGRKFQLAKTHCPRGHLYSGRNLRIAVNGQRVCRSCANMHSRRSRARLSHRG